MGESRKSQQMNRVTANFIVFLLVLNVLQCKKYLVEVDDEKAKGGITQENPPLVEDSEYEDVTLGDEFRKIMAEAMEEGGGRKGKDFRNKLVELSKKIVERESDIELNEMASDGGIDLNELKTVLAKNDLETSPMIIDRFKELDTNENGLLEKSEVESEDDGEDYGYGWAAALVGPAVTSLLL